MGIETKPVQELQDEQSPLEALFGKISERNRRHTGYPDNTVFKVFVGCMYDDDSRLEWERLLTKSFHCQNVLEKPGDLAIVTLNGTFDKVGAYHVAARYAIIPPEVKSEVSPKATTDSPC